MNKRTPSFWYRPENSPPSLFEIALLPLSWAYAVGHKINQSLYTPQKAKLPVICIGNLVAGGAGKTPAVLAVMRALKEHHIIEKGCFLTRGYGAAIKCPLLVDLAKHDFKETGDEALLLAQREQTIVSPERLAGAELAAKNNAEVIVMDDGLYNPGIKKDISIVVIDGRMGFGNGRTLPAGPLREKLDAGLKRADAFVVIGKDERNIIACLPPEKPLFKAKLQTREEDKPPGTKSYYAFSGLGYPDKFFKYLSEDLNLNIQKTRRFPDHYAYTSGDISTLKKDAESLGAALITTEKDAVRLSGNDKNGIYVLPVRLNWDNEEALVSFLQKSLKKT